MRIEIDQSGKIEQTEKDTILCLSNDKWYALKIKATTKRQIQEVFRRNGQIRNFIIFTFSAGLAILLRKVKPKTKVTIDQEYSGKNPVIKNILSRLLLQEKYQPVIEFKRIGKNSKADFYAAEVGRKHLKATWTISEKDILREIKKTEVGKRLKDA